MNRYCFIFLIFFLALKITAAPDEWLFERSYKDSRLFLHAFINYSFDLDEDYEWEKYRLSRNGTRFAAGSVSTNDLLINGQLMVNQDLGNGWYFLNRLHYHATRHYHTEEKTVLLGLEKTIYKHYSTFILIQPSFDKEYTDIRFGVSSTDQNREKYMRIALVLDDPLYDHKTKLGSETTQYPVGIHWLFRVEKNNWCIFSEGKWTTGHKRRYIKPELSPVIRFHQQQINHMTIKLYYRFQNGSLLQFSAEHYDFLESHRYYQAENNYRFSDQLTHGAVKYLMRIHPNSHLILQAHGVWMNAESCGYRAHDFSRLDMMPAAFYKFFTGKNTLIFGYFHSQFEWEYLSRAGIRNYNKQGLTEKLLIGWSWQFNKQANIQISLSHETELNNFGGGSIRYRIFF